jgi:hypothetical protein
MTESGASRDRKREGFEMISERVSEALLWFPEGPPVAGGSCWSEAHRHV